jgi:hypothetical protein
VAASSVLQLHRKCATLQEIITVHHGALLSLRCLTYLQLTEAALNLGSDMDLPLPPTLQHLNLRDTL